jgi:uncharacterized membrane protein YqaE (UPF0057 family)
MYVAFQPTRFIPSFVAEPQCVRSYRTFSPLPPKVGGIAFCDTFCIPIAGESHPLDGVVLYVVRTFLIMGLDQFLSLTPKKYKEMTGEKLGLKKTLQLKAAQKFIKKELKREADIDKGLYVLLAILGLAWVAMGVMDDWSGSDWIVNLILYALCYLPGLIHALTKMKKYY